MDRFSHDECIDCIKFKLLNGCVDISILVLVFNAAAGNRTALPMFQEHIWRHYNYLRDSIPELVPDLQVGGATPGMEV